MHKVPSPISTHALGCFHRNLVPACAQDEARCEAMLARVDSMSGSDDTDLSDSTATNFDDHARLAIAESLQKPLDLLVLDH